MFINVRHNCAFQENSKKKKKKFGNNFCAPELYTLKFITRKLWLRKHLLHHYLQIFI